MAEHLLSLRDSAESASVDCLLLVCYSRARRQLASSIEDAAHEKDVKNTLDQNSILSVSKERVPIICQKCVEQPVFSGSVPVSLRGPGSYEIRTRPAGQKKTSRTTAAQPRRYVMPPSLASLSPGKD